MRLFAFESACKVCELERRRDELGSFGASKTLAGSVKPPGTISDVTKAARKVPSN